MERTLIKDCLKKIEKEVEVCGFVKNIRDHGKILFLDIEDSSGILQVVFEVKKKSKLTPYSVVKIQGKIKKRPQNKINPNLKTGEIELKAKNIEILSFAKSLPFLPEKREEVSEEVRLKYRYLDLRSKTLQRNLKKRDEVCFFVRDFLRKKGFIEIETPYLSKSTPEGARDFLVPSRLNPGKFYALPQSPQQYKQLLMVAGFEKYFQIVRCFRDEDLRKDRQPEFTQIDIEMSFADEKDIMELTEKLLFNLVSSLFPQKRIKEYPFPRLSFEEAQKKFKTETPDLREKKDELAFCFIYDFPMFEKEETKIKATHHPFTKPQIKSIDDFKKNIFQIKAKQYDLVLNGIEIGGGSERETNPEIIKKVFEILGHSEEEIKKNFSHLFEAFSFGVPPHAGIALGLDRLLMILLEEDSIRDVIAFPKTGEGYDLMMGAPAEVEKDQLDELGISIVKETKKD